MERDIANFRVIDQRLKIKRGAMCTACGLAIGPDFRSVAQVDGESIIHAGLVCLPSCLLRAGLFLQDMLYHRGRDTQLPGYYTRFDSCLDRGTN